jgi:hypothetical protein
VGFWAKGKNYNYFRMRMFKELIVDNIKAKLINDNEI